MPTLTSSRKPCEGVVDSAWVCRHKSSREWQIIVHQPTAFRARSEAQVHMHCGYDEVDLVAYSVWKKNGSPVLVYDCPICGSLNPWHCLNLARHTMDGTPREPPK